MATVNSVAGTDTPNTGRAIWNANDLSLETEVEAATADIATHKGAANTDHDAHNDGRYSVLGHTHDDRYYTETEIDATAVKLTGAQTVAGVKTLTDIPVVKNAAAGVTLQAADGDPVGKLLAVQEGADCKIALHAYSNADAQFIEMIRGYADDETVDTPYADLYSRGKAVATQEYVQARIRSGTFVVQYSFYVASLSASTTYQFTNAGGGKMVQILPMGSRISKMIIATGQGASNLFDQVHEELINHAVSTADQRGYFLQLMVGADSSGCAFDISLEELSTAIPDGDTVDTYNSTTMGLTKLAASTATLVTVTLVVTY